jgi:hypothetical protein
MSNPSTVSLQLAAAVANGICQAQAVAAAGNLTLNGTLVSGGVATMDVARRVLMASSGNDAAVVFTITGTDRNGNVQTETLTGLNAAATAFTVRDFLTVTRIAASAVCVGNITAGTNGTASTVWVQDNFTSECWMLSVGVVIVSGTATYTVEHTYDDPNRIGTSLATPPEQWSETPGGFTPALPWSHPILVGLSATAEGTYDNKPVFAHRLTITAGTGLVAMQSIQAGIGFA